MRFKIFLGTIFIFTIYYKVTFSKFIFENYSSTTALTTCGKILPQPYVRSRIACSKICLSKLWCTGIIFNHNVILLDERCKLVFPACAYSINQINWTNYIYYAARDALQLDTKTNCNKGNIPGIIVSHKWAFPCPRLHFSLDSETFGARGGPTSINISFVPSEILNSAFQLPNPNGNIKAHFNLGHYPNTSYCFPDPEGCEQGVVFAFWLNVINGINSFQGFITTMGHSIFCPYPPYGRHWNSRRNCRK